MTLCRNFRRLLPALLCLIFIALPASGRCGADSATPATESGTHPRSLLDSPSLRLKGGAAFSTEEGVQAIRISGGGWGEIDPPAGMRGREGTLSLRVKPLWKRTEESRPLFSMRWGDAKSGYMVISQGWWEPTGAQRLYFIFNNEEFAHCSASIEIANGEWSEISVTWRSGPAGFCRLYVNGDRVAETRLSMAGDFLPRGPLFIGSDRGTSMVAGRRADALFAELTAQDYALSDGDIANIFAKREGGEARAGERKASWNKQLLERVPIPEPPRGSRGTLRESRVIFDEDMEWATSRAATDRVIATIKKAGFNVYIPCVWYGGNALYPSTLAPMPPTLVRAKSRAGDPLAYLIDQAHLSGIEVHPWFEVMRRDGGAFPEFAGDGVPAGAYDVHNPRFRSFIVGLITDVVRRYRVDGINLDYIRSLGNCTGASCRADYRRFAGRDLLADIGDSTNRKDAAISIRDWNRHAVGDIVSAIAVKARRIRPGLIISVDSSLNSDYFLSQGNDAIAWANKGLVDVVFHMDYGLCPDWKTAANARQQFNDGKKMVMLLADFAILDHGAVPFDGRLLADFVRLARALKAGGTAFYHRPQLSEQQVAILAGTVFKGTARTFWTEMPEK
jgi:hypothetical protein